MTTEGTLFATLAAAVSAIALLTCPTVAQALPMFPLAPPCPQYAFTGLNVLNQSNGYRLEFNAEGPKNNTASVVAFDNSQAKVNRGDLSAHIAGREISFDVYWDDGVIGVYEGSVDDLGYARGTTSGGGGSANWNFATQLKCVTPSAPQPTPAPQPIPAPAQQAPPQQAPPQQGRPNDRDSDGLLDGDEASVYGTNPDVADTDGDGPDDGQEVFDGTDPLDPNDP